MSRWNEVATGTTVAATDQFLRALGDRADLVLDRMKDPRFAQRLAEYAANGGVHVTPAHHRAGQIMGWDKIFTPGDASLYLGLVPSEHEVEFLSEIVTPQGRTITKQEMHTAKSHGLGVLVAVLPMSIQYVYEHLSEKAHPPFEGQKEHLREMEHICSQEGFCQTDATPGWYLLPNGIENGMPANLMFYVHYAFFLKNGWEFGRNGPGMNGSWTPAETSERGHKVSLFLKKDYSQVNINDHR